MRWTPKAKPEWRRFFAVLPVTTICGKRVWLEHVERRDTFIGSSWFEDHFKTEFRLPVEAGEH